MEKLDLINTRYDPADLLPKSRVHDSCEDHAIKTTMKIGVNSNNSAAVPFKSTKPRFQKETQGCGSNKQDFTITDKNGEYFEVSRKLEGKLLQRFSETQCSDGHFKEKKDRIDVPVMNRIMDNIYDLKTDDIKTRIEQNKVKGAIWSITTRPDLVTSTSHPGPGDYDLTAHESRRLERSQQKFNLAPSGRGVSPELPPFDMWDFKRTRKEWKEVTGQTQSSDLAPLRHSYSEGTVNRQPKIVAPERGLNKFTKTGRWKTPLYKQENYIKTTGLILSQDWDKSLDKRIPFSLNDTSKRSSGLEGVSSISANVDIDVDCGSKSTVAKIVKTCPIKYSAAFKSTAEVGLAIPPPVSGVNGGPGSFPGANPPSVVVREPHKQSTFFLKDRELLPTRVAAPDIQADLKPNPLPRGGQFEEAGKVKCDNMRNFHMQQYAKKKISKIYPRLAHKKFEKLFTLEDMLAAIPTGDGTRGPKNTFA